MNVFLLVVLKTITQTTVSIVRASENIRKGITIKLTEEKINPPKHANAKNTNVPVRNIAIAFIFVSVVTNLININFNSKAMSVKYQYSIVS